MRHRHRLSGLRRAGLARQAHDPDLRPERSREARAHPRLRPARPGARRDRHRCRPTCTAPISTGPKGNRVYFGYGTDKGGVLQIVDREKLLNGPKEPTPENLRYPEIGQLDMSAWNGAHTTFPMLQMPIAGIRQGQGRRDPRLRRDRRRGRSATSARSARQMVRFVDVTIETTTDRWSRPSWCPRRAAISAAAAAASARTPRTRAWRRSSTRGSRSSTYFNAGVRAIDVRDPYHPKEIGYYIPAITEATDKRCITGRRQGALQGRDPDQQRRDGRSRLHLHRRSRQHRHAHPRTDRRRPQGRRPTVTSTLRRADIVSSISEAPPFFSPPPRAGEGQGGGPSATSCRGVTPLPRKRERGKEAR